MPPPQMTAALPGGGAGTELERLSAEGLALLETAPNRALELGERARQLAFESGSEIGLARSSFVVGGAHSRLGDLEAAHEAYLTAACAYERLGDDHGQAVALMNVGRINRARGELPLAAERYAAALEAARRASDRRLEADALNSLASLRHSLGDDASSLKLMLEAVELKRAIGDRGGEAGCLNNLGLIHTALGDYPQALEFLFAAYAVFKEHVQNAKLEANCLINIGLAFEQLADHGRALERYAEGLEIARRSGDRLNEAVCLMNMGSVLERLERPGEAVGLLEEALTLFAEVGFRRGEVYALGFLGKAHERLAQPAAALAAQRRALRIARETGEREGEVNALLAIGHIQLGQGEHPAALETVRRALRLARRSGFKKLVFTSHEHLAEVYRRAGDLASALEHYVEFHRLEKEVFSEAAERKGAVLTARFEVEKARREAEFYRLRDEVAQRAREEAEATVRSRTLELQAAQIDVVTRLALAAEYRDDRTGEHTWRVGRVSALLARGLGIPEERAELLRLAARLHDVGKIATPDAILLKPGALTPAEYRAIEAHTLVGARILSGGHSQLLAVAEEVALTHHERWDGRGYPNGLAGPAIPLTGRIVALADVFDALTSERPYKRAWRTEEALEEIERQSGRHFDPAVVAVALRVLRADEPVLEPIGPSRFQDPLTRLGNRVALEADLGSELLQAARRGSLVRVLSLTVEAEPLTGGLELALARTLRERLKAAGRLYRVAPGCYAAVLPLDGPGSGSAPGEASDGASLGLVKAADDLRNAGAFSFSLRLGEAAYPGDAATAAGLVELSARRSGLSDPGSRASPRRVPLIRRRRR